MQYALRLTSGVRPATAAKADVEEQDVGFCGFRVGGAELPDYAAPGPGRSASPANGEGVSR